MFNKFRILVVLMLLVFCSNHASDNATSVVKQTITLGDITLHYEFADARSGQH